MTAAELERLAGELGIDVAGAAPATAYEELRGRDDRLYVPRNDARYLRRNALVALGNSGEGSLAPLAEAHARGDDPMLREHAEWALARLRPSAGGADHGRPLQEKG